ncbi:MAG: hypothetical protein JNG84_04435, partial [Archangium sp.]|nr:hypothetical protein [Archangium sp.]
DGGSKDGGGGTACVTADDCPDSRLFACSPNTGTCEPACRSKDDCSAGARGAYALDFCAGGLGCQCDDGRCTAALCSADDDCGSQVCRNGACVPAPAATEATKCTVVPDFVVLKPGAKRTFTLSTWTATNQPIIVKAGGTWSAPAGSPFTGSGTGLTAEFTAASATPGTSAVAAVSVTVGGATCTAKAIVVAPPSSGVGVMTLDELSGRPVANVDVMLSLPDGTVVQQTGGPTVKSDARGYAALTGQPNGAYSISAFHAEFGYVTIANYSSATADKDFLAIFLRRNTPDNFGGYKGVFTGVPSTGNVHAGIASMSLAGGLTTLSIPQLLGPTALTRVKIGDAIDRMNVPLPAGVYLAFADSPVKANVSALGLAGTCLANGVADEAQITAGRCGTRTAWALSGDVPLNELPLEQIALGLNSIDYTTLLSKVIPLFKRFNSTIVRDVQFTLKASAYDNATAKYDFSDTSSFTAQDLSFAPGAGSNAVPLSFSYAATLPDLPRFRGNYADGVIVLSGANVLGRGVVPLGLGAAINTSPRDTKVDAQAGLPVGQVQVRMAPTHHGIEGSQYAIVFGALSSDSVNDASAPIGASSLLARLPGNKLLFDPSGTTPVNFAGQTFLPYPETARFNFLDVLQGSLAPRTFTFGTAPNVSTVQVMRVTFTDATEHLWDVYIDPTKAAQGFTLPKPPGALADRVFTRGVLSGGRSAMVTEMFRLKTDAANFASADVTFNGLFELNSTNFDRFTEFLTAFTFVNASRPKIAFVTPAANPMTVTAGSKVTMKVTFIKIGTGTGAEAQLGLAFTSNGVPVAGCTAATLRTETMTNNGTVEYTLPSTCTGSNITVTATLLDLATAPQPISPPVSASTVISIQ